MTNLIRLAVVTLLSLVTAGSLLSIDAARAQQPFKVSASAAAATYPSGADAAVFVRIEGSTTALPSFTYAVEGGTLAGILPPTPVAANIAQGTVFVNRDSAGIARVTVGFAGQELAAAEVRFVAVATLEVRTTLNAGIDAAARTWRYEVVDASGSVVATLSTATSGDVPVATAAASLPSGSYTVRQVLGSDTVSTCTSTSFYEVSAPAGASTAVELSANRTLDFTIRPCPALPNDLQVQIPVDTIVPGSGAGVVGEAEGLVPPGETPFSEVAGARQPGTIPFPPNTGDSALAVESAGVSYLPIALGMVALSLPFLGWSLKERVAIRRR